MKTRYGVAAFGLVVGSLVAGAGSSEKGAKQKDDGG